jgi:hypothetical protein
MTNNLKMIQSSLKCNAENNSYEQAVPISRRFYKVEKIKKIRHNDNNVDIPNFST